MNETKHSGFTHLIFAIRWSFAGFRRAVQDELAFRQELFFFIFLAPVALWIGKTHIEIILLVGSLLMVLIVELLNTAVETAINRIGGEVHDLSKKAKDVGSAAVMLSIVSALFVWGTILLR
ncbi:MAG: diacylglycerol kinase [Nitrospiria bacterium]